jgi:hypothetical protein
MIKSELNFLPSGKTKRGRIMKASARPTVACLKVSPDNNQPLQRGHLPLNMSFAVLLPLSSNAKKKARQQALAEAIARHSQLSEKQPLKLIGLELGHLNNEVNFREWADRRICLSLLPSLFTCEESIEVPFPAGNA